MNDITDTLLTRNRAYGIAVSSHVLGMFLCLTIGVSHIEGGGWVSAIMFLFYMAGVIQGTLWIDRLLTVASPAKQEADSTGIAFVDHSYFWRDMKDCPRNMKVQLLGQGGVAVYGYYNGKDTFWRGWAPLPKERDEAAS